MSGSYRALAGPQVPPLQIERREKLLAWLRANVRPMSATEIVYCAHGVYGAGDVGVARNDLNQLERYGLVRFGGYPKRWSAT